MRKEKKSEVQQNILLNDGMLWEINFKSTANVMYYYIPGSQHNNSDGEGCSARKQNSQHTYCDLFINLVIVLKVFVLLSGKAWVQSVLSVLLWDGG